MNRSLSLAIGLFAMTSWATAQFTNIATSGWWRTNPPGTNQGRGLAVGNLTAWPFPAAFQVHGDLTATLTGEVFRTNASQTILGVANPTYWRMFHGGSTPADERGQLFAVPTLGHFNINSPNGHFQLHTETVQRARLNGNVTSNMGPPTAPPFTNVNRDGFFALSGTADAFTNIGSRAPFTRLHLVDNAVNPNDPVVYAQQHGFRPWQRNGITFTGNSDQSYIGHKYGANDNTDFVIQWSDNANGSPWGTDRMKFVFNTEYNAGFTRGAASVDGLEALRLWPRNHQEVNVGIGDFFAGNQLTPATVVDPTERVDILNGRLRIRQLPDDSAAVDSFYVMVVDRTTLTPGNQERGVVKWVDPSVFGGGGADCDWTLENDGVSGPAVSHNVYTAVGVSDDCPDDDDRVGIGTATPEAKLHVKKAVVIDPGNDRAALFHNPNGAISSIGAQGWADAGIHNIGVYGLAENANRLYGVWGEARNSGGGAYGVRAEAYDAITPTGLYASAIGGSTAYGVEGLASGGALLNHGIAGSAYGGEQAIGVSGTASSGSSANFGVYGRAVGTNAWAGWFDGDIWVQNTGFFTNGAATISDENLKTGIEDVLGALATVIQLEPKTYTFNSADYPMMNLSAAPQIGLLAQDVEEVVPEAVQSAVYPAQFDSLGNETSAAFPLKAIDYNKLIPLLIGAVKELSEQNVQMQEQVAAVQQQLAACCASPNDDGTRSTTGSAVDEGAITPAQERLLRIAPNPFTDRTTLFCTLEHAGRMQLLVNSSDGRSLMVLSEGQREAGEFQYEWSTENLAPGGYYITLLLDGEPVVKRAVKVGR